MKFKRVVSSLFAVVAMASASFAMAQAINLNACCTPADSDWPKVNGNLGNQSYSSLTQITKANINNLGAAWMVHTSAVPSTTPVASPGTTNTGSQTAPIAVNGIVYTDTPSGAVIAVNGATGAVIWKWTPTTAASGFGPYGSTRRGVAVGGGLVYTSGNNNYVVALNQNTGAQVWAVIPPPPAGQTTLGDIGAVAPVYYNGMVYVGSINGNLNAGFALNATNGALVWEFYGAAAPGVVVTDVNGVTTNAGATWGTSTPACYSQGGAAPWMLPAIDPALNMVYWTFGNSRGCNSSQDGSTRPGINLFSSSMVAMDATTGAYKWHFQSVHHGQWDMDNTHPPALADVTINGQLRHVVYYGSKQGRTFVLDRTNGLPVLGAITEVPVSVDSRQQSWPTQPYPAQPSWVPECVVYQNLGSSIPGNPSRAVPNYNGFQAQPDPANPGQLKLVYNPNSYIAADDPFVTSAYPAGQPKHMGCMNEPSWALPVLSTPSNNGSADFAGQAFSQDLGLLYIPYGYNPSAHDTSEPSNGLRATGQYQTGGILALNGTTGLVAWRQEASATQSGGAIGVDLAHGNTPLATASDLLFVIQTDGNLVAMDATNGNVLWKFQTGFPGSSGVITYMANGQQYIAVMATGNGIPYSPPSGDALWAFTLGGSAVYTNSAGAVVSGSSEAPTPPPLVIRRPVSGSPTNGSTTSPPNTILLARTSASPTAAKDSTSTSAMFPQQLQVPVGTTVTFLNPGPSGTDTGNTKPHCATQFFEGLFNPTLNPGQSFQYTFTRAGEYFYNDCTDPRPTGKVIVTLTPQAAPLTVLPSVLQLRSPTGVFTGVTGVFQTVLTVPAGWTLATSGPVGSPWIGPVTITTPLTTMPFNAVTSAQSADGLTLVATFNRSDIVNNVPAGLSVPLTVTATFTNSAGTQVQLAGTTNVRVLK